MRHAVFLVFVAAYVVVMGVNLGAYVSAMLLTAYVRNGGNLRSVPFRIG